MLRTVTVALVAICFSAGAFAADRGKLRHTLPADRDPYADPAAPYKADRLSSPHAAEPIANLPGQVTVLTRQVLDDKNATTLSDALRTTAGVTVGR